MGRQFIVEGCDGLGKDVLINSIIEEIGYHPVIHYEKPKTLEFYENSVISPAYEYQYASFVSLMRLIDSKVPIIFNRSHIGEAVYADLYRGYSGDYIFDLEKHYNLGTQYHMKLVLLTCSDWQYAMNNGLITDDGESFDYDNKGYEQMKFMETVNRSIIPNKYVVDILTDDEYGQLGDKRRKTVQEILKEIDL